MNILFFLTPKVDVAYIYDTFSLRQVLEKMEYHKYSCIPVLNEKGKYVGTITEGDLLQRKCRLLLLREGQTIRRCGWIRTWRICWIRPCVRILYR